MPRHAREMREEMRESERKRAKHRTTEQQDVLCGERLQLQDCAERALRWLDFLPRLSRTTSNLSEQASKSQANERLRVNSLENTSTREDCG